MPSAPDFEAEADARPTSGEEATALLRRADADYQAGDLAAAKRACEALIAADILTSWALFFLGRIHRDEANDDQAMACFTGAIERDGKLFWAHSERLILAKDGAAPLDRLDDFARDMAAIDWEPLQAGHVRQIELAAHALWDGGRVEAGHLLFERLWPSPDLQPLALVRIVEADRGGAMVAEAIRRLEALSDLDETALRILLQHYDHRDDLDGEIAFLERRRDADPSDFQARLALAYACAREIARERGSAAFGHRAVEAASADRLAGLIGDPAAIEAASIRTDDVRRLETVAHVLWDEGRADAAYQLLARLWPSSDLDPLALVRLIEADRDQILTAKAAERLVAFAELDDDALRVLSQHYERQGDLEAEIAFLERLTVAAPLDFDPWISLVRAYAGIGDNEKMAAALAHLGAAEPHQRSLAKLWANIELGDTDTAFHGFRNHARLFAEAPKVPGIRLTHLLGDAFDLGRRDEVLAIVRAHHDSDPEIALLEVNAAMRDQRWEEARALFEKHFGGMTERSQSVRLANIEIHSFSGHLETANALLDRERIDGVAPPAFLRATLRILSELGRWEEVFDAGVAELAGDASFEHFLSVMVRAARRIGRATELFKALLALPRPLKQAQQDALFAVMEDLAEAGHVDIFNHAGDIAIPRERGDRIELKLRAAASGKTVKRDKNLCIYYCTDREYLTPALVSLTSLAMTNAAVTRRAVFKIVVDTDVVPIATEAAGAIARRLGFALDVVDAATILSSPDRLRTNYGLFTGGQQLALAAYYRIFFARHLVEQRDYAQALYIDADTMVRGGLEELFSIDRAAPLMARYETDRPEVRYATKVHRLKGRYFNSGILCFDLAHPDLPDLLDRAIAAAIDPAVKLIFQDQCALNIAFDMRMSELPARYNYFSPPNISGDGVAAEDAVIVHFLDRPKPWDSLYRRPAREWFQWFDLVETLRQGDAPG